VIRRNELAYCAAKLVSGDSRWVGLEDSRLRLDDLAERSVRENVAVRRRARLAPPDEQLFAGMRVDPAGELQDEPALADARFPDERQELGCPLGLDALERCAHDLEHIGPVDERRPTFPRELDAATSSGRKGLPDENWLGLPFCQHRVGFAVLD